MSLFDECIDSLRKNNNVELIDGTKKQEIETLFYSKFSFTSWGRIEWEKVLKKINISSVNEFHNINMEQNVFIIWSDTELPIVKTTFNNAITNIEDVLAVSFDTWVLFADLKSIIEFYHEDEIIFGNIE